MRFCWRVAAAFALAAVAITFAAPASAAGVSVSPRRLVSGPSPLPAPGELGWCGTGARERDWEQDNALAVNPANRDNLVAAWIQDWADGIVVGYSKDGGQTWRKAVPRTTPCTSGLTDFGTVPGTVSAIDPWVAFGGDGVAYLTSVVSGASGSAEIVNTSRDGGRTWTAPTVVGRATFPDVVDYSYVVADQARPGVAYATWFVLHTALGSSQQYVASTVDGGVTWSAPAAIAGGVTPFGTRLFVLSDGSLLDVVAEHPPQVGAVPGQIATGESILVGPTTLTARRLEAPLDPASTWSEPAVIGIADAGRFVIPGAALGPDGRTVFVAWTATDATRSHFNLFYAASADGGVTWRAPGVATDCLSEPLPSGCAGPAIAGAPATGNNDVPITPSVSVAPDGTIGILFYDHRCGLPSVDPPHDTDVWFRSSRDGGATWAETHVAGVFDQGTAPLGVVGDFHGISPVAKGFAVTFALAQPFASYNTDIFSLRLALSAK